MSVQRRHDWASRLVAQVEAARQRPFAWGGADCCLTACDMVQAMTGVDPAAHFRGRYKTKAGAFRALKAFAGGGLEETAQRITTGLAMPEVPPLAAQRGDVCLVETLQGPALGICLGAQVAVQGPLGLALLPMHQALRAWRV
ncbi:MAG: hypothetical protein KKF77_03485 [Proteobacteria bacterium]|nr:hypothetical protein [Pseudomonadota bacterium]